MPIYLSKFVLQPTTPRTLRSHGLGMLTNLYAQFPDTGEEGQLWQFAWTQVSLALHIILGLLVFGGALMLLIRSITYKNRTWIVAGSIGLAGILIAIYGGVRFIPTQNDPYSLLMSIAFIVSLLAYVWGLFVSKN